MAEHGVHAAAGRVPRSEAAAALVEAESLPSLWSMVSPPPGHMQRSVAAFLQKVLIALVCSLYYGCQRCRRPALKAEARGWVVAETGVGGLASLDCEARR